MHWTYFLLSPDEGSGGSGGGEGSEGTGDEGTEGTAHEGTEGSGTQEDLIPRSELSRVNREAAKYRRKAQELQKQLEDREAQDKTELERERDRAVKAEQSLNETRQKARQLRVQVLAGKVGIVPEARADAARLLDWDKLTDPDDEGEVEEALRDLVKDRPFLLGNVPGGADGGAGGSRTTESNDMNTRLRQAAGRA